ncbi:membrane protein insertase YidC [Actinomyces wuliandei]|uniref:membrane protein insertase YidC n=1 Tax=Actinomyces wuliandei TaxID=2057743 RepID=UPI00111BB541|nr:membrane protein insertase YidC [Actinomyces wuliandei]
MDNILWPLSVVVAWVMVHIHDFLVFLGFQDGPGIAWVLSIIGLTVVVRILIMPLMFRQIRSSRGMQLMQPEMQALREKYKGKKDPVSQQRQQEEMMALYRKHGTNPLSSCLPLLVQMPVFIALFRVLASLQRVAEGSYNGRSSIGPLTADIASDIQASNVFGAHLSDSFVSTPDVQVRVVTVIMIIIMSVTQWYTMAQLSMKNMPESAKNSDNPMIRSQRIMIMVMPLIFAISGVQFQIGVLVYWVTSNIWTLGQQFFTIRNMPAPGSEAEKKYRARVNARRARKGLPSLEEEERAEAAAKAEADRRARGQRRQPTRKERRGKSGRAALAHHTSGGSSAEGEDAGPRRSQNGSYRGGGIEGTSSKHDSLTDEEIARRRYEKRARARRQEAARRKKRRHR